MPVTLQVARALCNEGIQAAYYHAAMEQQERKEAQERWMSDEVRVICATVAFGMGINKPDVRFVVHHSLPKSLEGYMQETGRAGRDGEGARCYLWYTYGDRQKIASMIEKSEQGDEESKQMQHQQLLQMISYAEVRLKSESFIGWSWLVHCGSSFSSLHGALPLSFNA